MRIDVQKLSKELKDRVDEKLTVVGSNGLYKIIGVKGFEMFIIAIDDLNPQIISNEALCTLSTNEEVSRKAALEILRRYSLESFIYTFTIIYRPEVARIVDAEPIPVDRLAMAIEVIGVDKLAKALGPERAKKLLVSLVKSLGKELAEQALREAFGNGE